jgi:hypothetical protein
MIRIPRLSDLPNNETGSRWAILRRVEVRESGNPEHLLITRYRIVTTPLFGVMVHALESPDDTRNLHNHPWPFFTLILRGGYDQLFSSSLDDAVADAESNQSQQTKVMLPGSFGWMTRNEFHAIAKLHRSPTWTLFITGPRLGKWGFATADGFVEHDEYGSDSSATALSPGRGGFD